MKSIFLQSIFCIVFFVAGALITMSHVSAAPILTPTPTPPAVLFVGVTRYDCSITLDATPTRISLPTVTNLPEATRTPLPTPTVAACAFQGIVTATSLNVRAEANVSSRILRTVSKGTLLGLQTKTGTWLSLCGGGFVSASWVQIQ